jgi:hypothetical protein
MIDSFKLKTEKCQVLISGERKKFMDSVEEIFDRIMEGEKWQKQELAEYIDVDPSTLSQKLGRHWNIHFRVFRKLLPLMLKFKIIKQEELQFDNLSVKLKHENQRRIQKKGRRRYIMSPLTRNPILSV